MGDRGCETPIADASDRGCETPIADASDRGLLSTTTAMLDVGPFLNLEELKHIKSWGFLGLTTSQVGGRTQSLMFPQLSARSVIPFRCC